MAKKPNDDQPAAAAQPKTTRQRKPHPVIVLARKGDGDFWTISGIEHGTEADARKALRNGGMAGTYRIVRLLSDVTVKAEQVTKVTLE